MGQMVSFLVKDDAATPKEWTFVPISDNPVPFWRSNDSSLPLEGLPVITMSDDKLKNGTHKLTVKLEVPTLETLGASGTALGYVAAPKVAYVTPVIITMFADARSSAQDRANALRLATGLLQGASNTTGTGTLVNTAAGGAFLGSTAAVPTFFTQLIQPV